MKPHPPLYAWLGEDELGSGEIGLKQALVPSGLIPIVSVDRDKAARDDIRRQLQMQADQYGKTIRLVRYVAVEILLEIEPRVSS
ncbi:MAG TPA: hypothetical protein VGH74_15515 [Planctomycetaceae bacterium]|jgi:hypothetical protein